MHKLHCSEWCYLKVSISLLYGGTGVTQTHHSVAFNSSQFERSEPLVVRNQFKWPWSLLVPVIGKYQAVHVAGKRLIRLENQDVKNSVTYEGSRLYQVSGIAQPCEKIENWLMAFIFLISLIPQPFLVREEYLHAQTTVWIKMSRPTLRNSLSPTAHTQRILSSNVSSIFNEQLHNFLISHTGSKW